ncbi:VOC family protein, partial [Rhizobium ruizarguesonis]
AVQPWGIYYGKLTYRFGVQWMLDCLEHDSEKCERFSDDTLF